MTNHRASFRMATADDHHLETYDHTKLSAMNTCPTYGILRYDMHKAMVGTGRSMALEAGSAMHECFAFIRLVTLMEQYANNSMMQDAIWHHHGTRLFGKDRLDYIAMTIERCTDATDVAKVGSIAVLNTSGFHDEPRDRRRTLSNLEECIYAYINRWRWDRPVWIRDPDDPQSDVGIEIPFDLVVDIEGVMEFRLTGRIDGIHTNAVGELNVQDNKTASRLGDAWAQSFLLSHQITGYCIAASTFIGQQVNRAEILGLAIPLPKSYDLGGFIREVVTRYDYHYSRWIEWLIHTVGLMRIYKGDPYNAPKYTHSCNRYFRPCTFIPFCDADDNEQRRTMEEMIDDEWSPLDKPLLDGIGSE